MIDYMNSRDGIGLDWNGLAQLRINFLGKEDIGMNRNELECSGSERSGVW